MTDTLSLTAARLKAHIRHRSGCSAWGSDHPQEWRDGDERLCDCGAADLLADAHAHAPEIEKLESACRQQELVNDRLRVSWNEDVGEARARAEAAESQLATLTQELANARSDFEAFAEHHRATEAQLAALTPLQDDLVASNKSMQLELEELYLARNRAVDRLAALTQEHEKLRDWRATVTVALQNPGGSFFEDVPKHIRALRTELAALMQDHAVCACGCPASEHESYGEEGESCEQEMHECVRTSTAVASMLTQLRAELATLKGPLAQAQALGSIPIGYYATVMARAEAAEYERDEARGALAQAQQEQENRMTFRLAGYYAYGDHERCIKHERIEHGGSHGWSCHKRAGHRGACSTQSDCGEISTGGVVCGLPPGHEGLHAWDLENAVQTFPLAQVDVARACSAETVAAHGAQQDRYALASAIEQVAIRLGITTGDIPQTGPEVLLLLQEIELAACHGALAKAQQEQENRMTFGLATTPPALDAVADIVLAYRPKPKTKPAKRRKRRAAKIAKGGNNASRN